MRRSARHVAPTQSTPHRQRGADERVSATRRDEARHPGKIPVMSVILHPMMRQVPDGWKQDFLEGVDTGTEGQPTLAGLVNGITYAAHVHADTSNPAALELETLAGNYLLASPAIFRHLAEQGGRGKRVRA